MNTQLKIFFFPFLLFSLGTLLISCGKEEDDSPKNTDSTSVIQKKIDPADVKDRKSLKSFVESARDYVSKVGYEQATSDFREAEGEWKSGSIYIFIAKIIDSPKPGSVILFHGGNRRLEGQDLWNAKDSNGVFFTQELVKSAKEGGGYVEYLFDDPSTPTVIPVPKVSYAIPLKGTKTPNLAIGSGYYK